MHSRFVLICLTICLPVFGKQLSFEKNAGQSADAQAAFLARTSSGWQVQARTDGSLRFRATKGGAEAAWKWAGARPNTSWIPASRETGISNYCLGRDRARWVQGVPSYSRIERKDLYPGIDFILYGAAGELEYDLIIHPGADPSQVRLEVTRGWLDGSGNIAAGGLLQRAPYTYQVAPNGEKVLVASRFVETSTKGLFRLDIADYRHDLSLIVDPIITGSTMFSGDREDTVVSVLPSVVTGYTRSALWDRPSDSSDADIFIRIEAFGNTSTTYWGGSGDDIPTAAYIDGFGSIFVAGYTNSLDFPIQGANAQATYGGGASDGFLINPNRTTGISSYIGGIGDDRLTAVDASTNVVFAGETTAGSGLFRAAAPSVSGPLGGIDAFAGVVEVNGMNITTFGGRGDDHATAMVALGNGSYAIAGYTNSNDFPVTATAYQSALGGGTDGWLARVSVSPGQAASIQNATYWGGSGDDRINALMAGVGGELVVAGSTASLDFPTLNAVRSKLAGPSDGFVSRFNRGSWLPTGSGLFGGSGDDSILALAATTNDDVIIGGSTTSQDLQVPGNVWQAGYGGGTDGFVAQLDRAAMPVWASYLGGQGEDRIVSVCLGPSGNSTGGLLIRIGGNTAAADWLSPIAPSFARSGQAGFAIDTEIIVVSGQDVIIGKDLQSTLAIQLAIPSSIDGVVNVRSSDPSKLLLSLGSSTGAAVVAFGGTGTMSAQALDSSGVVDVVISGRGIPQRTLKVTLAPSVVALALPKTLTTSVGQNLSLQALFEALDPMTGLPVASQTVRPGIDPALRLISSDDSGIHPVSGSLGNVEVRKSGTYTLTVASPVFNTLPGDKADVTVTDTPPVSFRDSYWFVPKNGQVYLTLNSFATLKFTSLDPGRVLVLDNNFQPQTSATLMGPGIAVIQSDEGFADVKIENADGTPYGTIHFALGRPAVTYSPRSMVLAVGAVGTIYGQYTADGDPPANYSKPPLSVPGFDLTAIIQQLAGGPVGFNGLGNYNGTNLVVMGVKTGTATVTLPVPDGTRALSPSTVNVQVVPASVSVNEGNDVLLGEGYYSWFDMYALGPANRDLVLEIADPNVAIFGNPGMPQKVTFNASSSYFQVTIVGKGKAGQSTTIKVTYAGTETTVNVGILPMFLKPVQSEIRLRGQGQIDLAPAIYDPKRKMTLTAGQPNNAFQPLDLVTDASNTDACIFGQTADQGRYGYLVKIACYGQGSVIARFSTPAGGLFVAPPKSAGVQIFALNDSRVQASSRVYVGNQLQVQTALPAGGTLSTVTSSNPSKVQLSLTPQGAGSESLQTAGVFYIRGFASEGTVRLVIDHADSGVQDEMWVFLMPSTIAFDQALYEVSSASATGNATQVSMGPAMVTQDLLPFPIPAGAMRNLFRAGTDPFQVKINNDNPAFAVMQSPTPILSDTANSASASYTLAGFGEAHLTIDQPAGFVPTAGTTLRVSKPRLVQLNEIVLGKDLQQVLSIGTLPANSAGPAQVTVTSLDPDKVLVSTDQVAAGSVSVVSRTNDRIYLQALTDSGTARLRVSAAGLDDLNVTAELLPTGLVFDSTVYATSQPDSTSYPSVHVVPVRGSKPLVPGNYFGLRPGVAGSIRVTSSNPAIAAVTGTGEQPLRADSAIAGFTLQYLKPGTAQLTFEVSPAGLGAPLTVTTTVTPWTLYLNIPSTMPASLVTAIPINGTRSLRQPAGQLSANPSGSVLFSLKATDAGSPAVQIPGGSDVLYATPVGTAGTSVSVSYLGLDTISNGGTFQIVAPQVALNYPNGNIGALLSAGAVAARISLGATAYDERPLAPGQDPVTVTLRSSNPAVAMPVVSSVVFSSGGVTHQDVSIKLAGKGTTVLSIEPPAGFAAADGWKQVLVTVQ